MGWVAQWQKYTTTTSS